MYNYIFESLLLGLSVGPVCLAYCSPVIVPLLSSSDNSKLSFNSFTLFLFLAGRYAGYLLVGIAVGIIGAGINQPLGKNFLAVVSVILGLTLIYFSMQKNFPELKLCRILKNYNSQKMFTIMLGFLTGLNLCPPFITAIAGAAGTGTIFGSVIYFTAFFAGTVVFFPVMVFFGLLSKIDAVKKVANICMMISGVWFAFKGLMFFF